MILSICEKTDQDLLGGPVIESFWFTDILLRTFALMFIKDIGT